MFLLNAIIYSVLLKIYFSLGYTELKKYSSVKVYPGEQVYMDIRDFDIGDTIKLEIKMNIFSDGSKERYDFYIDQVPASNFHDNYYWTGLRKVTNKKVSCDDDKCTFRWDEIKQAGNNYIYIKPVEPYNSQYWYDIIKIKNLGGLSLGAIVGIVFGCIVFAAIASIIISYYCCKRNARCYNYCRCCGCCPCYRQKGYTGAYNTSVQIQPAIYPKPLVIPGVVPSPTPVPVYPNAVGFPPSGYGQSPSEPYSDSNIV